jgi:predicted DNA-binding protein (MmcQ/YjbR family)
MAHPRMYDESNPALKRLRQLCLALPHAFEKEAWGECTYRVTGGSMFAMTDSNHHDSGHIAVWVKAPPMVQEILVHADAKRFFVPPYVGPKGWVGVRLDYKVDWEELGEILKDGYMLSAPKKLRAGMQSADGDQAPAAVRRAKRRPAPPSKTPRKRTGKSPAQPRPRAGHG